MRFTDHSTNDSLIKLMTDGILLAECHSDPWLNRYDCLIIDEAHERSLNIDFLLGYLKRLLRKRRDLKLIITSATIDPELFARHFDDAPIIHVSGRSYPVEVRYRPLESEDADGNSLEMSEGVVRAVEELSQRDRGDILVFLAGERDIRDTAEALRKQASPRALANTEILPLLARQSPGEQNRIFQPGGQRRIILATNVAETSLTVPGIRYVIDTGLARISRYSWRSKIQRLPVEKISQASAEQRKGRCGRVAPGVCIRLYSEDDYNDREAFTPAEIKRTNLAAVILQMEYQRLGHIDDFPFVEAPDPRMVSDGYKLLFELGAIDDQHRLTTLGKQLARLPIDPRLARMLVEADREAALDEVLTIVAALAVQDFRLIPQEHRQAAEEKHRQFADSQSDFVFYLNVWRAFHEQKQALSGNALRRWCQQQFLSWRRIREWRDTRRQIADMLKQAGFSFNSQAAGYDAIHRALLPGLLSHVGQKDEGREYIGARGRRYAIFPGSMLYKNGPQWMMSAEIVETSRVYARINARIDPRWLEEKAAHLIRRSHRDPHWQSRRGQVAAFEQASLFGLILYSERKVNYGPIDPAQCHEIFLRHALVKMQWHHPGEFFAHNRRQIEAVRALEAKSRKPDILVDEDSLLAHFAAIVPKTVCNGPQFNRWYKQADAATRRKLFLQREQLMRHDATSVDTWRFPDYLELGGSRFPLRYHFDTRHRRDGVSLTIPFACLDMVQPQRCEWLVPGLLQEKMTALIRSLPKNLRKHFVPAPDFARACFEALQAEDFPLTAALAAQLKKMTGVSIPYDAWRLDRLAPHLLMHFRITAADGRVLAEGRDLPALKRQLEGYEDDSAAAGQTREPAFVRRKVDESVLDELPERIVQSVNGVEVTAWPSLACKGAQVDVEIRANREQARQGFRQGLRQLFINRLGEAATRLPRQLAERPQLHLAYSAFGKPDELEHDLLAASIDACFIAEAGIDALRGKQAFAEALNRGRGHLAEHFNRNARLLGEILQRYRAIRRQLKQAPLNLLDTVSDIQDQLDHLFPPRFILEVGAQHLQHYPRYLAAIEKRLEKAQQNPRRERQLRLTFAPLWQQYKERERSNRAQQRISPQLQQWRWMLEEWRVSLFAQALKTPYPVSEKRLKQAWQDITG